MAHRSFRAHRQDFAALALRDTRQIQPSQRTNSVSALINPRVLSRVHRTRKEHCRKSASRIELRQVRARSPAKERFRSLVIGLSVAMSLSLNVPVDPAPSRVSSTLGG